MGIWCFSIFELIYSTCK